MYVCMYVCIADSEAPAAAEASSRPKAYASSRDWDKVSSEITQVSLSPTATATITITITTMILTHINLLYRSWKQRSLKEKRLSTLSSSRYTSNYIYALHTAHTYIHTLLGCHLKCTYIQY